MVAKFLQKRNKYFLYHFHRPFYPTILARIELEDIQNVWWYNIFINWMKWFLPVGTFQKDLLLLLLQSPVFSAYLTDTKFSAPYCLQYEQKFQLPGKICCLLSTDPCPLPVHKPHSSLPNFHSRTTFKSNWLGRVFFILFSPTGFSA